MDTAPSSKPPSEPHSEPPAERRPRSPAHVFLAFSRLALRGFGGVLPWAQRTLVDEERWMTDREFVDVLALAQVLPGPNVCNVALMVGDRFFGWRGAVAALGGMMAAPLAIVLALALLHARFADLAAVAAALRGMGAVSAGLLIGMALRLLPGLRAGRAGWVFVAAAFAGAGILRWPLLGVMGALGSASVALAWRRLPRPLLPKPPAPGAGT